MVGTIESSDLRWRVREALECVRTECKPIVLRPGNSPQAASIPFEDFQACQEWWADRQKRTAWPAKFLAIAEEEARVL